MGKYKRGFWSWGFFSLLLDVFLYWDYARLQGLRFQVKGSHLNFSMPSLIFCRFLDGKDYLITFGGSSEHCEPLAGSVYTFMLASLKGEWISVPGSLAVVLRCLFVCPSTVKIWTDMLAVSSNKGSRDISNNSSNHNNINGNKTRRKEETITSRTLVPTTQQRSMHRFTTVCSSR